MSFPGFLFDFWCLAFIDRFFFYHIGYCFKCGCYFYSYTDWEFPFFSNLIALSLLDVLWFVLNFVGLYVQWGIKRTVLNIQQLCATSLSKSSDQHFYHTKFIFSIWTKGTQNDDFCVYRVGLVILKISLIPHLSLAVAFHSFSWVAVFTGCCDYAQLFVSFCMWIDSCVPSEGILIIKNVFFNIIDSKGSRTLLKDIPMFLVNDPVRYLSLFSVSLLD